MTSPRRIFVLLFTLLPLLAAQCWGLCGIPVRPAASHHDLPPCHAPSTPEKSAPAPCCTVSTAFDIPSDAVAHFTPQPEVVETALISLYPPSRLQLPAIVWLRSSFTPPPNFPLVLRV